MSFEEERAQAERALAAQAGDPAPEFPEVATRIQQARERLGISEEELVRRWGADPSVHWDLELHNDELFQCVDFETLPKLAAALEVPLMAILFGEEPPEPIDKVSYQEVAGRIANRMRSESLTVQRLSEIVGWELQPILERPEALGSYNIAGVHDVCQAVGIDWVGLLQ